MIKPSIPSSGSLPSGTKTDVQKVAENIGDVVNVSSSISNGLFNKVVENISPVGTVATGMDQVITVAQIHDAVNAVALNQKTITEVANELAIIGDCSVNMATLLVLQGHLSKLLNIESSLTEICAVGKNEKHINSVFEAIPDIATLISHMADIHFIAQYQTELSKIFENIDAVISIATNLDAINTVSDSIDIIKEAAVYVEQLNENMAKIQAIEANVIKLEKATVEHVQITTERAAKAHESQLAATASEDAALASKLSSEAASSAATTSANKAKQSELKSKSSETLAAEYAKSSKNSEGIVTAAATEAVTAKNQTVELAATATQAAKDSAISASESEIASGKSKQAAEESKGSAADSLASAIRAEDLANSALTNKNLAVASANAAAGSSTTASTAANTATVKANEAKAHASTAAQQQAEATKQANVAISQASLAQGHASSSTAEANKAKAQADIATVQATSATKSNTEALGHSNAAKLHADKSVAEAVKAKSSAVNAANSLAEMKKYTPYPSAMTKADFDANREMNKDKYAGSGCLDNPIITTTEQDGALIFPASAANVFTQCKTKKVVDGVAHYLDKSDIRLPDVPDGTKSYDSATDIVTDHLTYLDPKYDNTPALSQSDAVSRCFEGLVANGDFRLGDHSYEVYGNASRIINNGSCVITSDTINENSNVRVNGIPIIDRPVEICISVVSILTGSPRFYYFDTQSVWTFVNLHIGINKITNSTGMGIGNYLGMFCIDGRFEVDNVSFRPVTSAPILTRQDLCFVEVNPNAECTVFKPLGNNQYGATTAEGITLKKLTDLGISQSVSGFGTWDKETVGYGELISSLTDAHLKTVLSNSKNNIRFDPIQNKLLQSEYKIRVEEGNNDTDTVDERMTKLGYVKDAVDVTRYNHSDGRQAIGVCLRQTLNSGAYHPIFNSSGTKPFWRDDGTDRQPWYISGVKTPVTVADCFSPSLDASGFIHPVLDGDISSGKGGRPTSFPDAYFDAVYAHQIKDLRITAHKQDVNKLRVDAMRKAVRGEMRGWGKVPFSHNFFSLNIVSENCGWTGSVTVLAFPKGTLTHQDGGKTINDAIGHVVVGGNVFDCYLFSTDSATADYIYLLQKYGDVRSEFMGEPLVQGASFVYLTPQNDTLAWTDLVGSPSAISKCFPNGVQGMWIPVLPVGGAKPFYANRKIVGKGTVTATTDNGVTWETGEFVGSVENQVTSTYTENDIRLCQYPTLSNFTQPANNAKVVGEVGDVTITTRHEVNQGNRLHESLLGNIGKDTNNALTDVSKTRQTTMLIEHVPHGFTSPANESTGCKVATSIIEKDGLLYSQYQAVEIVNNGTDWGDTSNAITAVNNDSTHTDDNGNTVKVVNHIGQIPLGIASYSDSSQSTK